MNADQGNVVRVSAKAFKMKIKNKKDFYEAMIRNGFYLPSYKSSLVTQTYMEKIMKGQLWCPMHGDIKRLPCPRPPSKEVLLDKFLNYMRAQGLTDQEHGVSLARSPDKDWLIDVVSTLMPDDEIFRKGYLPPRTRAINSEVDTIEVNQFFLEDLPVSSTKSKRTRLQLVTQGTKAAKTLYMKQRIDAMARQLHDMEQ